jgi:uncharacterized protein (TIGR00730 family)
VNASPIDNLLDGMDLGRNRRLGRQLLGSALALLADQPDQLDLKIASAALEEMREAFKMFAPFHDVPKVTIFGSARTQMADPLYMQARDVATKLAAAGWMVVTGAGPGIMQAGMEGAGRDMSIGVSIRLPFEQGANPIIAGDMKYVSMKYFFTRKLMLIKESKGFICLPGGFGTLDETFELLTLTQTGKGLPVPIVLLDTPGDQYWETVHDFVGRQLVERGLVAAADTQLYLVTEDGQTAVDEVLGFYRNYDSIRYIGHLIVMRMKQGPTDEELEALNERFGPLCSPGGIVRATPFEPERKENDRLDLARLTFTLANHSSGIMREIIDTVNSFVAV